MLNGGNKTATFSKISVVTSCSKYIRAMTFETFCQEDVVFAQACLSSCALVSASSSSPTAARSPTAALATRSEVWASNEEDVCADEVRGWAGGEDVRALAQMELDVARRLQVTPTHTHVFEDSVGAHSLHLDDTDIDCDRSKETYYSVKRDLLQCQKRPDASHGCSHIQKRLVTVSKETYYSVKRDLIHHGCSHIQKRPITVYVCVVEV